MTYATESAKLASFPFVVAKLELDTTISDGGAEYHCMGRCPLGQLFHSSIAENGFDPTPTQMTPGEGLGFRGQVTLTLQDFNFGANGTYWGKLLANNDYYLDRALKIYEGFHQPGTTFEWDNFVEKLYYIKKIQGPDSKGKVIITAADPLTLLDSDQAIIDFGDDAALASSLSNSATGTTDIGDNTGFSASGGYAVIEDEVISYSGTSGADSIIIDGRNEFGTTAATHASGKPVRPVFTFDSDNVVDVVRNLIEQHTPIDHATLIPDTDWNAERDSFLIGSNATGVLLPGDSVKDVIEELSDEFQLALWFDDEDQEIKLKAIGPLIAAAKRYNVNEHILNEGEDVFRDPSAAVTEVLVHIGRSDHIQDDEKFNNYSIHYYVPNLAATTGHGKAKVREIYAKYIPGTGSATASRYADRVLSRLSLGKMTYQFRLHVKDAGLKVGDVVEAYTPRIQGTDGLPVPTSFMVIRRDRVRQNIYEYKAIRTGYAQGSQYRLIAPNSLSAVTYATATDEQRATYMFIANSAGEFSNSDPGHWIY